MNEFPKTAENSQKKSTKKLSTGGAFRNPSIWKLTAFGNSFVTGLTVFDKMAELVSDFMEEVLKNLFPSVLETMKKTKLFFRRRGLNSLEPKLQQNIW